MNQFDGRSVVVTGAGGGIGQVCAREFARQGAVVILADKDSKAIQEASLMLEDAPGQTFPFSCDVTDEIQVKELVSFSSEKGKGRIDVLVNNAGIMRHGSVIELSKTDWETVIDTNLGSVYLTCKYVIPVMIENGGGSIVNLSSIQAFAMTRSLSAYVTSKGGIVSLTKAIAIDFADRNIRCNVVAPGSVNTEMLTETVAGFSDDIDASMAALNKLHPIGRIGTPEDIAQAVLFLAGDTAAFCTGACLVFDGGRLASLGYV